MTLTRFTPASTPIDSSPSSLFVVGAGQTYIALIAVSKSSPFDVHLYAQEAKVTNLVLVVEGKLWSGADYPQHLFYPHRVATPQARERTGERASEMESYGVCVSQGRGSRLSVSLALTQTP